MGVALTWIAGALLAFGLVGTLRLHAGASRVARSLDEALHRGDVSDAGLQSEGQDPGRDPDHSDPGRESGVYLLPAWVPVVDPGLAGVDEILALTQIDPRVVEGMDFWLSDNLTDFSKLKRVVEEAVAGEGYDGWLNALKGYVAEQVAADVLVTQGAQVELAPAPNQAGWDLLVDGQPFNVKVGASTSHIAEHFQEYPDIGVITSPELAAQFPEHAEMIIALPELANDHLVELVEGTLDGVTGLDWDFSFPAVTALLAGLRELHLLNRGATDLSNSFRNFALDVAGTGVGTWAGGEVGAAIGSVIAGPLGAAILGLAGAILGAFFGRSVTNEVKLQSLKRAQEAFETRRTAVMEELKRRHKALQEAVLGEAKRAELDLGATLRQLEASHRRTAEQVRAEYRAALSRFLATVPDGLEAAAARLAADTQRAVEVLPQSHCLVRLLWPSRDDIVRHGLTLWSRRARKRLRAAATDIRSLVASLGPDAAYEGVTALLKHRLLQVSELEGPVRELAGFHTRALTALALEKKKLEEAAKRAAVSKARELAAFIDQSARSLHSWLEEENKRLRELAEQVRIEARRLGFDPMKG